MKEPYNRAEHIERLIEDATEREVTEAIGNSVSAPRAAPEWADTVGELLAFVLRRWSRMDGWLIPEEAERFVGLCEDAKHLLPHVLRDHYNTYLPQEPEPPEPDEPAEPLSMGQGPDRRIGLYPAVLP